VTKENNSIRRLKEAVADIESMIGDNCKHPLYRPLQEIKHYTRTVDTSFSIWLRANPSLDPSVADLCIADMDWVIYQYKRHDDKNGDRRIRNLMFVEEKTFGASVGWQQHELLSVIHQLMPRPKNGGRAPGKRITIQGYGTVYVRYFGFHVLQFSHAGPLDSETIKWDGITISVEQLEQLMRFDIHPTTLNPRDDRRHHANQSSMIPLFQLIPNGGLR